VYEKLLAPKIMKLDSTSMTPTTDFIKLYSSGGTGSLTVGMSSGQ